MTDKSYLLLFEYFMILLFCEEAYSINGMECHIKCYNMTTDG